MKLTKLQLKQIVAEELAKEGTLGGAFPSLFGSRKKKEFGYKWFDKPFHKMTPAEQEKYKEMGKERGRGARETEKAAAGAEASAKAKAREREEEERIEKHKRKVAAMDPKQRSIYLGWEKPEDTSRVPGYFKGRQTIQREAGGKLTKSDLEKIIREELKELMQETEKRGPTTGGAMAASYDDPNELALSIPLKSDPNHPVTVLKRSLERTLRGIKPEHQQRTADEWATTMKLRVGGVAYEIMKKLKKERDPWL